MRIPVVTWERLANVIRPTTKATHAAARAPPPRYRWCARTALCDNGCGTVAAVARRDSCGTPHTGKPQCHTDGGGTEAVVEAHLGLQQAGDQRADERPEVDAQIEQREPAVAARVTFGVEGAQQRGRVGLQRSRPQCDEHQTDGDPGQAGQDRQCDVAAHDHHPAVEARSAPYPAAGRPPNRPAPSTGRPGRRMRRRCRSRWSWVAPGRLR